MLTSANDSFIRDAAGLVGGGIDAGLYYFSTTAVGDPAPDVLIGRNRGLDGSGTAINLHGDLFVNDTAVRLPRHPLSHPRPHVGPYSYAASDVRRRRLPVLYGHCELSGRHVF